MECLICGKKTKNDCYCVKCTRTGKKRRHKENSLKESKPKPIYYDRKVVKLDKKGNEIYVYNSQNEAAKFNNVSNAIISMIVNGKRKYCKNHTYKYKYYYI